MQNPLNKQQVCALCGGLIDDKGVARVTYHEEKRWFVKPMPQAQQAPTPEAPPTTPFPPQVPVQEPPPSEVPLEIPHPTGPLISPPSAPVSRGQWFFF